MMSDEQIDAFERIVRRIIKNERAKAEKNVIERLISEAGDVELAGENEQGDTVLLADWLRFYLDEGIRYGN